MLPNGFTVIRPQGNDDLVITFPIHRVDLVEISDDGRMSRAERSAPEQLGAGGRPLVGQTDRLNGEVAAGATPLRPVIRHGEKLSPDTNQNYCGYGKAISLGQILKIEFSPSV